MLKTRRKHSPLLIFACILLLFSIASVRRSNVKTPRKVYHCGYNVSKLTDILLPEFLVARLGEGPPPSRRDMLFVGLHGGCSQDATFPGQVVYVNGEPHGGNTIRGSYYLGPISADVKSLRRFQFYYASLAVLEIPGALDTLDSRPRGTSEKFALHVSSRCLQHRERIFDLLSILGNITAGGKCHGIHTSNYDELPISGAWYDSHTSQAFSHYKFGLVMENSISAGYITEKILLAFLGGTVQIYYGTEQVFDLFNRNALIHINRDDPHAALDEVKFLLSNSTAYDVKASQPIFARGAREKYFWGGFGSQIKLIRKFLHVTD